MLLVRHGQSTWNAQGRWQGQADPPLSDAGRNEATLAAETLGALPGPVFASPLLRAKQTAELISNALGDGTVFIEPGLREIDVGDFSGLTNDEIEQRLPDAWKALRAGELEQFPSGESREEFRLRVFVALAGLAHRHPNVELLVVMHGGTIAAIERHLGVHPGVGVRNLEGRWFRVLGEEIEADGDRLNLVEPPSG
jgi:broad specificity phosphatase PhoE